MLHARAPQKRIKKVAAPALQKKAQGELAFLNNTMASAHVSYSLTEELRGFSLHGHQTIIEEKEGITYFSNEFWTAQQRQAARIHEISYRACFKPQLPAFFISRLTALGGVVYDPFMGRGTTPLQAALMGRYGLGNDINPLSVLLTRPRLSPPVLAAVAARLKTINWEKKVDYPKDLLVFYHPETLQHIAALRAYLLQKEKKGTRDAVDDWIRMVAINRLSGHSPGFFSVYSMPPNQAVSVEAQRKINEKRKQKPPLRNVAEIILKKSKALLSEGVIPSALPHQLSVADARDNPAVAVASVDLVVTSPPFLDVVQYASDNWLRCWFAGIDAEAVPMSMHRKPEDWQAFIRDVFVDLARVVKPGGHVAFEVGEVRGGALPLEKLVIGALNPKIFSCLGVMINAQEFTKTANCWGVANNTKGTNTNRIVLAARR